MLLQKYLILIFTLGINILSTQAQELKDSIPTSIVFPKDRAYAIMKVATRNFVSKHMSSYVSDAEARRIVKSDKTYIQLYDIDGIYVSPPFSSKKAKYVWDDKNKGGNIIPYEAYVTGLNSTKDGSVSFHESIYTNATGMDYFYSSYSNKFGNDIFHHMRSLELYGPLNPDQLSNYDFKILSKETTDTYSFYNITFKTKRRAFMRGSRICCEGIIKINDKGNIVNIYISDIQDHFSNFVRTKNLLTSVTDCSMSITYETTDIGIYTKQLCEEVVWHENETEHDNQYYYTELPPCRNPFDKKISTKTVITFLNPKIMDETTINELLPYLSDTEVPYYVGDTDLQYWKNKHLVDPLFPSIRSDIESFSQQDMDSQATQSQLEFISDIMLHLKQNNIISQDIVDTAKIRLKLMKQIAKSYKSNTQL